MLMWKCKDEVQGRQNKIVAYIYMGKSIKVEKKQGYKSSKKEIYRLENGDGSERDIDKKKSYEKVHMREK